MNDVSYNRSFRLTLRQPADGEFFRTHQEVTEITALRCAFKIEKHVGNDPNTAELHVFNLNRESRAALERRPIQLQLEAGYQDKLALLFVGDVRFTESVLDSVDWDTHIQVAEGDRARKHARVRKSYRRGVSANQLVKDLAKSMGLQPPANVAAARDMFKKFANGAVLSGPSYREMTRLLAPLGREWSIQDGQLQILGPREVRPEEALRIALDTGMVGSPSFGGPAGKNEPPTLRVKSLLRPDVLPGSRILVESRTIAGHFRVDSLSHIGYTYGQEWYTEIEAFPL